ncbi:MAG TPA: tryptophan synthase subunit alpha, partial [Gammaproteobacteria bacterium]|nr:tryptophan synthase subunit alpha [Gammaproteobacteria bacterium]
MKSISRLKKFFSHSQKANLAYLTAGDGGIQFTFDAAMALIKGGANMLEIGIPFSDPIADGPVIQQASQRAIAAGTTLKDILWLVKKIREHSDLPIILFSYLNPILKAYSTDFFKDARDASVDGILLVDCPIEESREIRNICQLHDIDLIYIISPSTPLKRIQYIKLHAQGFLY